MEQVQVSSVKAAMVLLRKARMHAAMLQKDLEDHTFNWFPADVAQRVVELQALDERVGQMLRQIYADTEAFPSSDSHEHTNFLQERCLYEQARRALSCVAKGVALTLNIRVRVVQNLADVLGVYRQPRKATPKVVKIHFGLAKAEKGGGDDGAA